MNQARPTPTIMIVDDNSFNLLVLQRVLAGLGYQISVARSGTDALEMVNGALPDLILLDVQMQDLDGYQVCMKLKADDATRDIPVIFVSSLNEAFNRLRGFKCGGVDFITKPVEDEEIRARVKTHLGMRVQSMELKRANQELSHRIHEMEDFNRAMVDREMRIIELKTEVNSLARAQGRAEPYPPVWETGT